MVEASIRYHRAARYDDMLQVSVRLDERCGASVVLTQEIRRDGPDGERLHSATIRAACLDSDGLKPRPLPPVLASLTGEQP